MTRGPFDLDDGVGCFVGGRQCLYWILQYDNMDYLKADSKGKCSNGTQLNPSANPPVVSCK